MILLALKFLQPGNNVPWQRVISSAGNISSRGPASAGAQIQREVLEAEGVQVRQTEMGELRISWTEYGWFPQSVNLNMNAQQAEEVEGAD